MIKQIINGKTVRTIRADMSSADATIFKGLLAGRLQTFEKKAEGGSNAPTPGFLNRKNFSCSTQVSADTRKSQAVYIQHINPQKNNLDIVPLVQGQFDVGYEDSTKADKCNIFYAKSQGE